MKKYLVYLLLLTVVLTGCFSNNNEEKKDIANATKRGSSVIELHYKSSFSETNIHYNADKKGWTSFPGIKMTKSSLFENYQYISINGSTLEFVFNYKGEKWDNNSNKNYFISKPGKYYVENGKVTEIIENSVIAENYAEIMDYGFFKDTGLKNGLRMYIDFSVKNWEYNKALLVKIKMKRENNVVETFLYRLYYKSNLENGREKWGTDEIVVYPDSVHHGRIKDIESNFIIHKSSNNAKESVYSKYTYKLGGYENLAIPKTGLGKATTISGINIDIPKKIDTSAAETAASYYTTNPLPKINGYFAPYDNPYIYVNKEVDKVISAKESDPTGYHYIHIAVFDINDSRIVDKLIYAHNKGIEVKILTADYHLDPNLNYETEYPKLQRSGIEMIGVNRPRAVSGSMHNKIAIYDGKVISTGSYNWDAGANNDNSENMLIINSEKLAALYEEMFQAIGGEPIKYRNFDINSKINVFYSQQHNVPKIIYDKINGAKKSIYVTMFTLRHLTFNENGSEKNVLDALVSAKKRGIDVKLLLEKSIADEGEYYGRITPNDLTDEWLASEGIEVIKIHTMKNNNPYAAVHHKFAVIDGETTLTGAYNWSPFSKVSDDDLIVIQDKTLADRYYSEFLNLRYYYDKTYNKTKAPLTTIEFSINNPNTKWGDVVGIVGSLPELGNWDSTKIVKLNGTAWPLWKGEITVPSGVHFEYKLAIINNGNVYLQSGDNRSYTVGVSQKETMAVNY